MSLFGKIAALFGGGTTRRVCVVDGDRMVGGDRVGPGERFQALNKLARFASREGMDVRVVFGGRPLREADDGTTFNGVQVFYGESPAEVQKRIEKALASAGRSNVVLVTSDQALESEMTGRGYASMRMSSLRKSMDPAGGEGGDRNNGRDRDRDRDGGRRNRSRSRGPRRPQNEQNQGGNQPTDAQGNRSAEAAPAGGSGGAKDSVKSLIDLVE